MDGLALTLAVVYVMRRATRAAALGLNNKLKFCHAFHVPSSCVGAPLSRRGPQRALFRSLGSDGRAAPPPPVTSTVALVRPSVRVRPFLQPPLSLSLSAQRSSFRSLYCLLPIVR